MSDKRKLQGEIDKCLKNVAELVSQFEELWDKAEAATSSNQKEKHESELKKTIKKLQKFRDSIKTWLTSSDAKAMEGKLKDNRRLIEVQMERYRDLERAAKTKAFSKEGLDKRSRLSPEEREKQDCRDWMNHCILELHIQIDMMEAEVAAASGSEEDELKEKIEKHKFYIGKLEAVIRCLDNDSLPAEMINEIKEEIELYVTDNREDPDFIDNEYVFDDLEEYLRDQGLPGALAPAELASREVEVSEPAVTKPKKTKKGKKKKKTDREESASAGSSQPSSRTSSAPSKVPSKAPPTPSSPAVPPTMLSAGVNFASAVGGHKDQTKEATEKPTRTQSMPAAAPPTSKSPAHAASSPKATTPKQQPSPAKTQSSPAAQPSPAKAAQQKQPVQTTSVSRRAPAPLPQSLLGHSFSETPGSPSSTPTSAPAHRTTSEQTMPQSPHFRQSGTPSSSMAPPASAIPALGPYTLFPCSSAAPTQVSNRVTLYSFEQSYKNSVESHALRREQTTAYTPQHRLQTPIPYYPEQPLDQFMTGMGFSKLDNDVLFFIFYYQQGTKQQLLAASELQQRGFRFHTQHQMWFVSERNPEEVTDQYEIGTFKFFDHKTTWNLVEQQGFKLEYRYMEGDHIPRMGPAQYA
eukprot:m.26007 g.26007  ORF g.26007 m.26007 type:complete len:634 (+) comp8781_c0_seq2:109-2010(+)